MRSTTPALPVWGPTPPLRSILTFSRPIRPLFSSLHAAAPALFDAVDDPEVPKSHRGQQQEQCQDPPCAAHAREPVYKTEGACRTAQVEEEIRVILPLDEFPSGGKADPGADRIGQGRQERPEHVVSSEIAVQARHEEIQDRGGGDNHMRQDVLQFPRAISRRRRRKEGEHGARQRDGDRPDRVCGTGRSGDEEPVVARFFIDISAPERYTVHIFV